MRLFLIRFVFLSCLSFFLTGCETLQSLASSGSSAELEDEYNDWNAEQFRSQAKIAVEAGNYDRAIKLYEALESRYPFGNESAQTQLDSAYAYYKNNDAEAAVAAADRFIKMNPRDTHVDYAYYLKGLANYNRNIGFVDRYLPTDIAQRDLTPSTEALQNFEELARRFPHSQYIPDAKQRIIGLKNNLAMHEVHIARYYIKRGAYIAAVNRSKTVVEQYQKTIAVPYALQIMEEAYLQLGMNDLAKDTAHIFATNYPNGITTPEQSQATLANQVWDFIGLEK